jgi:putative ABC transport system substrate-binding protein
MSFGILGTKMKRREFITLLGGAAAAPILGPRAARAQQPTMPVIGFLSSGSRDLSVDRVQAFRQGLGEIGYVEGRNVAIEYRWANGDYDRLPALASELVSRRVALIGAFGGIPGALAAKAATTTIPVVFVLGVDPVQFRLVESLNRPGGNVTGITLLDASLAPKHLQLLRELVPSASVIALLVNPDNPNSEGVVRAVEEAARVLGLIILALKARSDRDVEQAFTSALQQRAGALIIGADPFFNGQLDRIAALAMRHSMPTLHSFREFAQAGGLISYGTNPPEAYRQMGVYAGRILKGETPADLPVQQVTKVELVINSKTAKALGVNVPLSLLGRADEVIE